METTTTILVLIILAALGLGLLLAYLFMKAATVRRTAYDEVKDQLAKTQNTLDTKAALEQELRQHLDTLHTELSEEKSKNKDQRKKLRSYKLTYAIHKAGFQKSARLISSSKKVLN